MRAQNFQDLPLKVPDGTTALVVSTGQAYVFVEELGGNKIGIWLPADIADRVQGYVKTTSGQPVKIQSTPLSKPSPFEWPEEEEEEEEEEEGPDPALEGWDDDPLDS